MKCPKCERLMRMYRGLRGRKLYLCETGGCFQEPISTATQ